MTAELQNLKIVLLGGDRREVELCRLWREKGIDVKTAGFENCSRLGEADRAGPPDLERAAVLIAPLSGIRAGGTVNAVYAGKPLSILRYINMPTKKYLLLAGSVASDLKSAIPCRTRFVSTAEDQELALLNAVPTAEGAVQKAMELSAITLHGSRAVVVGLGRCGTVLARTLQGLGARVTAAVRRPETAALASTMGLDAVFESRLPEAVSEAEYIFNTAPAPVLGAGLLKKMRKDALVLDLAAAPGGTDFQAAKELGITALLLPGLPGKAAPRTAALILSRVYRRMIAENCV